MTVHSPYRRTAKRLPVLKNRKLIRRGEAAVSPRRLPFTLPASVISLILLLILLLSGGVKERTIQGTSHFLIDNMGLFFIPSVVGTLEYLDVLKLQFVPFLVVSLVSTPLVYAATAWSVRLLMKLFHAKEASHD